MERDVILYIGLSLDGCIADACGGVGWLEGQEPGWPGDYGYAGFYGEVDTVLMGGTTYRQITQELSVHEWPYAGKQTYVFTTRPDRDRKDVAFVDGDAAGLVRKLKGEPGKAIWLCGGADLAAQLMAAGLVDEYRLAVMPVMLGGGVRLFREGLPEQRLRLTGCREENGAVLLTYRARREL